MGRKEKRYDRCERRNCRVLRAVVRSALLLSAMALLLTVPGAGLAAEREQWTDYDAQPLRVNIWHDRDEGDVYRRGESVRIHFETKQDAYAVVYRIDASGEVTVLWPRSRMDDGFVFGGHVYNLPSPGAPRIKVGAEDGIEYIEAVVSLYPFDLRGLDLDFHHEREDVSRAFFVAGDPFLAMNEINHEITGLEDPADFVVTNYTNYYVGREVAHPRYMCSQCHDDDVRYEPYRDTCSIEIHYDYGWYNDWYGRYGYYPVYYYPAYYYVDPWTWSPWVNYWYRPWYRWPGGFAYSWGWDCYVWNYSPYWRGDSWVRYKAGNRRYRPLDKGVRYKSLADGTPFNNPKGLVKTGRPTADMESTLRTKTIVARPGSKPGGDVAKSPTADRKIYKNVAARDRAPAVIDRSAAQKSKAGLRIPGGSRSSTISTGKGARTLSGSRATSSSRVKSVPQSGASGSSGDKVLKSRSGGAAKSSGTVRKSVVPLEKGSRVWKGRGDTAKSSGKAQDSAVRNRNTSGKSGTGGSSIRESGSNPQREPRKSPTVKPVPRGGSSPVKRPAPVKRSSPRSGNQSNGKSGGSTTKNTGGGRR